MRQLNAHQRAKNTRLVDTANARGDNVVDLTEEEQYEEACRRSAVEYAMYNENNSFSMDSFQTDNSSSHVLTNSFLANSNSNFTTNSFPTNSNTNLPCDQTQPTNNQTTNSVTLNKSISPMPSMGTVSRVLQQQPKADT